MYSVQNPIKSIPAHQLKVGQKFVKVINGNPCLTIYRFLGLLGGMVKCTSIDDNSPRLFNQFCLVKFLPSPFERVPLSSLDVGQDFSIIYGIHNTSPLYRVTLKGDYLTEVWGSDDTIPRNLPSDTIVKFIPHA